MESLEKSIGPPKLESLIVKNRLHIPSEILFRGVKYAGLLQRKTPSEMAYVKLGIFCPLSIAHKGFQNWQVRKL